VAGLVANLALSFVPLALPIAVFFSTIYCLNRLSSDSEYIAMRAAGLTKEKILLPFLLVAALLATSVYQLNQNFIPHSNKEFKRKVNYLTSSGLLAGIKSGQFFNLIPGLTLFTTRSTKYGRSLEEVFLQIKDKKTNDDRVIFAARGELIFERDPNSLIEKLTLILFNGNIIGQNDKNEIEKILFTKYIFPISQSQFQDRFSVKETMLSSNELKQVLSMTFKEAETLYKFTKKDFFNAKYEYWNRKNGALIIFVFCFLGFSLGITGTRGKGKNSAVIGILCLILYYGLFFSLVSMAKKDQVPVQLAVFFPASVMVMVSLWFYKKLDWQS
jgi:lipopolysaccharide export system permease protein